jgi:hypothetical protein
MPTLASDLRSKLERVVIEARDAAEAGALAALETLAIHHHDPYIHMKPAERELRNQLRARARQLGDRRLPKPSSTGQDHEIGHLVGDCAYEHWHRMLFARFLAENSLLIEPQENQAISLTEAEELAKEDGVNVWVFASRCAQKMLPQIFRPEDPLLKVSFAPEHRLKLETLLASLPQALFTASDALGWVYQFWQSKKKDEVNRSEVKIGADEISAVTQLFTEPYMVEFLLHNTLGAWWAYRKLTVEDAANAKTEDELRRKLALHSIDWRYLRFARDADGEGGSWRPAAGTFDGWPNAAKDIKVLDPCCGSGHFLVAALHHLVPLRMAEEGSSTAQAVDAVLRDNLHGLEIDERCCQIAAFALAFAAWTFPDAGGFRTLPELHIACTGMAPQASKEQWLRLGEEVAAKGGMPVKRDLFGTEDSLLSAPVKGTLEALHQLFSQAPILGSLINPANLRPDLFQVEYKTVAPLLSAVLGVQDTTGETREQAIAATGMAKAAGLLADKYSLITTNVPYLGRSDQHLSLKDYCELHHPTTKADLSACFLERGLSLCSRGGAFASVMPLSVPLQPRYRAFREHLLKTESLAFLALLGPHGFETIGGERVSVCLLCISHSSPGQEHLFAGIDALSKSTPVGKAQELMTHDVRLLAQADMLKNPESRIVLEPLDSTELLRSHAACIQGLATADDPQFTCNFWELPQIDNGWEPLCGTVETTTLYGGRERLLRWEGGKGRYYRNAQRLKAEGRLGGWKSGSEARGRLGVLVSQMSLMPVTLYTGEFYDHNASVIVADDIAKLPAMWCYASSGNFAAEVRKLDKSLKPSNNVFVQVPFSLPEWRKAAAERYPNGLPEPESDDLTQWLFHGRPDESKSPLQVSVARLLGYRWPAELDGKMRLSSKARALTSRCDELAKYADDKGIVCIPSVRGEEPAVDRLLALLGAAGVKPAQVRELTGGDDLEVWLRNNYFEEHCKLFHDRPFVWHIWDGRKHDGFHALINYHKLCEAEGKGRKLLESLTYSYLGEWITRQTDEAKRGEGGAEERLAAAQELQKRLRAILTGEPPFDLFVRWKPLAEQPVGWEPDIYDGVRINIRPLLSSDLPAGRTGAGILRWKPNIKWTKDRGKEPERPKAEYPWFWGWDEKTEDFIGGNKFDGNRHNDCHYSNKAKQAARDARKGPQRG